MTAKQYLQQARWLNTRVEAAFERVQRLRAQAERCTAAYGHNPGGGSNQDRHADTIAKLVDAERELDERIDRMVDARREIERTIDRIPDERMKALLEMRYLNGYKWQLVARKMHYSYENVQRLHSAALKKVQHEMKVYTK